MSQRRLLSSLAAIGAALVITTRLAVLSFPINAPAQTVVKGGTGLLHRAPIEYPAEAVENGVQGTVVVEATLNDRGMVTDARVLSGLEPLRRAALKSVLEWHYSLPVQSPVQVAIDFTLPANRSGVAGGTIGTVQDRLQTQAQDTLANRFVNHVIKQILFGGVSPSLRETILGRLPVREGDSIQPDTLAKMRQIVREVDEHLEIRFQTLKKEGGDEVVLTIFNTAPTENLTTAPGGQRIRVGGNVQATMVLNYVQPEYPALAKQARIQGVVRLAVVISKEGTVMDIKAESGHPLLVPIAIDAVRQWTYKPTLLNGQPVEVATVVDVNFALSQ